MTDRTISLIVALDSELRIDDAQCIINAIKMIKFVRDVKPNEFTCDDSMNAWAAECEFKRKIVKQLLEELK